jgi:hypothetical protein
LGFPVFSIRNEIIEIRTAEFVFLKGSEPVVSQVKRFHPEWGPGICDFHNIREIGELHQIYRCRFGMESSYRMRNKVKTFTISKNPALCYLNAFISSLFENVWVAFQWLFFTPFRCGSRNVKPEQF